jgi:hypothetical protein
MTQDLAYDGELLPPEKLEELWNLSSLWRGISTERSIENALSGNDPAAARSYLYCLHVFLRDGKPDIPEVRQFAATAMERYLVQNGSKKSLGQMFGVERGKRGNPPVRAGGMDAVFGLIKFLHEEQHFPMGVASSGFDAFEVASQLIKRFMGRDFSPLTLRDHWYGPKKGERR